MNILLLRMKNCGVLPPTPCKLLQGSPVLRTPVKEKKIPIITHDTDDEEARRVEEVFENE